jgi:hypothetical protein
MLDFNNNNIYQILVSLPINASDITIITLLESLNDGDKATLINGLSKASRLSLLTKRVVTYIYTSNILSVIDSRDKFSIVMHALENNYLPIETNNIINSYADNNERIPTATLLKLNNIETIKRFKAAKGPFNHNDLYGAMTSEYTHGIDIIFEQDRTQIEDQFTDYVSFDGVNPKQLIYVLEKLKAANIHYNIFCGHTSMLKFIQHNTSDIIKNLIEYHVITEDNLLSLEGKEFSNYEVAKIFIDRKIRIRFDGYIGTY